MTPLFFCIMGHFSSIADFPDTQKETVALKEMLQLTAIHRHGGTLLSPTPSIVSFHQFLSEKHLWIIFSRETINQGCQWLQEENPPNFHKQNLQCQYFQVWCNFPDICAVVALAIFHSLANISGKRDLCRHHTNVKPWCRKELNSPAGHGNVVKIRST